MDISSTAFIFKKFSIGGQWSWQVQAVNTPTQSYQVSDIITPFGRLTDIHTPIPGDIISEMASSIVQLQNQLSPMLSLVSGTPIAYGVTITEGDLTKQIAVIPFQNIGALGSFMSVTSTPSTPWLSSVPAITSGLNKNDKGQSVIWLKTNDLLANRSPYSGVVNFQDNRNTPTIIPININVIVLPRPIIGNSPSNINFSYIVPGYISNSPITLIVSNTGPVGSLLNFKVSKANNSSWLKIEPQDGGPLASGGTSNILCSLIPASIPNFSGVLSEIIMVTSNNTLISPINIPVTLTVTA